MAILDLQGMQAPAQRGGGGKSGGSKGCNNAGSNISLLLCG